MLSALKRRILEALRQSLVPRLEKRCAGLNTPAEMSEKEREAFLAGFRAGFWQGASDSMTIGLDVLKDAAKEQAQKESTEEAPPPTYASA